MAGTIKPRRRTRWRGAALLVLAAVLLGKRALAPGRYRATVTATDLVGNRSTPTRTTFTIVRR